jgi:hypothetical protein
MELKVRHEAILAMHPTLDRGNRANHFTYFTAAAVVPDSLA